MPGLTEHATSANFPDSNADVRSTEHVISANFSDSNADVRSDRKRNMY